MARMNKSQPSSHSFRARGFSLLEVAVASALAGIIAIAAIGSFATLNRQLVRLQYETQASDNAKTLIDFLVSDFQALGGGAVRPWAALWVEDGNDPASAARCASFGCSPGQISDRITYATTVPRSRTCTIEGLGGGKVQGSGTGFSCCLRQLMIEDKGGFIDDGARRMLGVFVKGGSWRHVGLENLDEDACTLSVKSGPMAGVDNVDGDNIYDGADATISPVTDFTGGVLTAVNVTTVFLDENTHTLFAFEERDGFAGSAVNIDVDERKRLARDIYDLQVQVGYDSNPGDGRLDDLGSTGDEWLYNASPDALVTSTRLVDLRMLSVGVVVGVNVRDPSYHSGAQVVGGPLRDVGGVHMRGAMGKAALRNIFVFF